ADLYPARAQGKGRCDRPTVSNTTRGDHRDAHGIDDLRNQRHGTDHAGSGKIAKTTPMPTSFESLRDDDVGASPGDWSAADDGGTSERPGSSVLRVFARTSCTSGACTAIDRPVCRTRRDAVRAGAVLQ